ncbi:BLUF domain-containing protein [Sphingomonas oryzagri]
MFQLTYISTAHADVRVTDVDEILNVSRRNNARDEITGLLVHDGVRFLQALEGDRQLVSAAFDRIRADPRHRATVILSERDVPARQFGDWAMASERAGLASGALSMPQIVDALVASVADANIRALFSSFARLDRRQGA